MPAPIPQHEYAARKREELRALDARLDDLLAGLDAPRRTWRPPEGGWSIDEVVEHLVVSNDTYLRLMAGLASAGAPRRQPTTTWMPSLMGRLLASSLRSPRKLPAPRIFRPGPAARPGAVEALHEQHRTIERLIEATDALEWRRVRTRSPVSPLIRLNLGDVFEILNVHTARHLGQIERLRARATTAAG